MLLIGGLTIAGAAVIITASRQVPEVLQSKRDTGIISLAAASQSRTFHLNDGSTVIVDADSRVTVRLDESSRQLRLEKGRARFEVTHDGRPFTVRAGRGSVRALGTKFDVSILNDQSVRVDLLRGSVEVKTSYRSGKSRTDQHERLAAGESVEFDADGVMQSVVVPRSVASRLWPEGLVTYNGKELGAVLEAPRVSRRLQLVRRSIRYEQDNQQIFT
ncbi:FecR family protein [Novosphingobium sp. ST904]|uniref:FecR family protein n=1 Tax=Novosphingobium sp. ST904 TaxID=1684385 RepID=UPI0006C8AF68|nr:FecR domain-containing protein [Novosphingobium sp. ST904]